MLSAELRHPVLPHPAPRRTDRPAEPGRTLDGLFSRAARRHPRAVVVREGLHQLSYGKADLLSARLATALLRTGVQLGDPVVVHCADHRQSLVAHLAVLKSGGVCVPVPGEVPAGQTAAIAAISGADTVLCSLTTHDRWEHGGRLQRLALDDPELWKRIGPWPLDRALPRSGPTEPAYLLTSGESGLWRSGHLVDHRAWHLAMAARSARTGPAGQTVTVTEQPSGPATLSAMWWAFGSGSTLNVRPDGLTRASLAGSVAVCETGRYPRVLDALAGEPPGSPPRAVLLVGAPCPPALAARHREVLPGTGLRAEFAPGGSVLPWGVSVFPSDEEAGGAGATVLAPAPGVRLSVRDVLGGTLRAGEVGEVCASGRTLPFDVIGDRAAGSRAGTPLGSGFGGYRRPDGGLEITGGPCPALPCPAPPPAAAGRKA
ncbi:AMP-binding protein [Streptomyces sp. NBC_01216]|uniref:AMP-binding protein n=1 Tax=unclassified Streptomyces TaxID=2593676 RepID=UPI002E12EC07|nr:acyl--CoA ligase [Streptomyces sp. NBC_01216]